MKLGIDHCCIMVGKYFENIEENYYMYKIVLYCFLLQESHVDRGDTQRAIAVFRDIAVSTYSNIQLKV